MTSTTPQLAFSHIGLFVTDLPRMEQFYTTVLALSVTDRGNLGKVQTLFLSRDPDEHHQVAMVTGRPADLDFTTINQISLRADGLETLRKVFARAARVGAAGLVSINHGNSLSVYFEDPEGNRIEVFIDTPWYVNQPMREAIDISQPDADIWAAVEARAREMAGFRSREAWRTEMRQLMKNNVI